MFAGGRRGLAVLATGAGMLALAATLSAVSDATTHPAPGGGPQHAVSTHPAAPAAAAAAKIAIAAGGRRVVRAAGAPSQRECQMEFFARCYSPRQFATAYDVAPLWRGQVTGRPVTGKGRTIVIVDSFGSPTIRHDLAKFDAAFGLPKAHLIVDQPVGRIPRYRGNNQERVDWASETTLDVDYAHAMAPGATIRLIETPVDETEGLQGLPQMMRAERWAIYHGHADVISQSFGATEQTFPSAKAIRGLRGTFEIAARRHVTVLAASGDNGATDYTKSMNSTYRHRVQSWPSTDPLVTSVGGLHLTLDNSGERVAQDRVWRDSYGAGGGGRSSVFGRPSWQRGVRSVVGNRRGVPDISMTADVNGGGLIWTSFKGQSPGWQLVGGTSMATPMFAGVMALADQAAGHRLGMINAALYRIGASTAKARRAAGLVDVTRGSNSFSGVPGFSAKPGFDLASGWGTVDAAKFVPALVAAMR